MVGCQLRLRQSPSCDALQKLRETSLTGSDRAGDFRRHEDTPERVERDCLHVFARAVAAQKKSCVFYSRIATHVIRKSENWQKVSTMICCSGKRKSLTKRSSRRLPAARFTFLMTTTVLEIFRRVPGSRG